MPDPGSHQPPCALDLTLDLAHASTARGGGWAQAWAQPPRTPGTASAYPSARPSPLPSPRRHGLRRHIAIRG